MSINPVITYDITDKVSCNANINLSTDEKLQLALGFNYKVGKEKEISVNFVENLNQLELQDSMVVLGY